MPTATFNKEDLLSLVYGDTCDTLEKVADEFAGTNRWSIAYSLVFKEKATGKFYEVGYSRGATEQQDEGPFEYEPDAIPCTEVQPVTKTITAYERVFP